jgi:hypothetical protein
MKSWWTPASVLAVLMALLAWDTWYAIADNTAEFREQTRAGVNGLKLLEGELHAASILFKAMPMEAQETLDADLKSLGSGLPGGLLVKDKLTLLLVDGRVLGRLRTLQPKRDNAVRVYGVLHDDGRSMTPVRIEYRNEGEWLTFDLPLSGTLAGGGVLGGDEP